MGEDRLAVFVQGKRYRYLQEIKDPQVGRETVEALQAVLTFAEGWLPSLRPESPQIEAQRPAVEERVAPPRPRLSDLILPGRRDAPSPPEALVPVEQIDKLLQERLQEHSGLAERRIGLSTDASGDLRVYVDGDTFSSVDEVPEPEIQALIRKAIRTWEESYGGPGRSR
jgi:hypothetical protein